MVNPKDYLEAGQKFHGHKCPAMPMGLRVGAAAMNKLGVDRAKDGQLIALVEIGKDHCATCFADGIQMITGCTLGKGNIQKLNYGKWGVTLIDRKSGKAVRVAPKAEAMANNKKSKFFSDYRMKGLPASSIPAEIADPLVENVMNAPDEKILIIGDVFDYQVENHPHTFDSFVCEECGEMVVEAYGRIKGDKKVCIPCSGWEA
ncbi:FmdE family protein [Tepidibacillus fermentans]|uniref:Formylmethanofuran dehydrogenase subunit E n=1 Tax=Tepidibacillus fermentans TaxID=1281767 RepID=A0A4V2UT06_9BACI|nr:FmdE family protein [Tepidibacillus fermentans]TCS83531.1 formylmethanofuran dehydrogenase subunit E [Tepidibacillus fermentans]